MNRKNIEEKGHLEEVIPVEVYEDAQVFSDAELEEFDKEECYTYSFT